MAVYYFLLGWILLLGPGLNRFSFLSEKRRNTICVVGIFCFLFLLSSLRLGIGYDYYRYTDLLDAARAHTALRALCPDVGFNFLISFLCGFGLSNEVIFSILAALCLLPVAWFILRYSPVAWLSCWLYVTVSFFYCSMNFIRQSLALSLLLLGWPLLRRRSLWGTAMFCLLVLFAALFHSTALIMLFVAFLLYIPLNRRTLILLAGADLVCVCFARQLLTFFAARDGGYYFFDYNIDPIFLQGLSPAFLLLPFALCFLALLFLPEMQCLHPDAELVVKMLCFSACIWSFITQFFILERFSLYTYCYILLAVPYIEQALHSHADAFPERSAAGKGIPISRRMLSVLVTGGILAATLAYQIFGMYNGTNGFHGVFPYYSFVHFLNRLP